MSGKELESGVNSEQKLSDLIEQLIALQKRDGELSIWETNRIEQMTTILKHAWLAVDVQKNIWKTQKEVIALTSTGLIEAPNYVSKDFILSMICDHERYNLEKFQEAWFIEITSEKSNWNETFELNLKNIHSHFGTTIDWYRTFHCLFSDEAIPDFEIYRQV